MAGQPPPHIAEHARHVQNWLAEEEALERARANPVESATDRFNRIRTAQAQALREGRVLPVPPPPVAVVVAPDLASMTPGQRWGAWRTPRG
jgi:hypothetical protein